MNTDNETLHAPTPSSMMPAGRHDSELFRVYALILDGITDHVLLPGKKLTESELCRQMVCSRNTVRGALSLLAHDKIVDLQPNRGAFVHVPDLKEMQDVFNARIEMESMILNLLSDMPDLETRLQPLYAMIEREEQASDSGDRVGWNRLSNAFHVELARLIDNHVPFLSYIFTVFKGSFPKEEFPPPKTIVILAPAFLEKREISMLFFFSNSTFIEKVPLSLS